MSSRYNHPYGHEPARARHERLAAEAAYNSHIQRTAPPEVSEPATSPRTGNTKHVPPRQEPPSSTPRGPQNCTRESMHAGSSHIGETFGGRARQPTRPPAPYGSSQACGYDPLDTPNRYRYGEEYHPEGTGDPAFSGYGSTYNSHAGEQYAPRTAHPGSGRAQGFPYEMGPRPRTTNYPDRGYPAARYAEYDSRPSRAPQYARGGNTRGYNDYGYNGYGSDTYEMRHRAPPPMGSARAGRGGNSGLGEIADFMNEVEQLGSGFDDEFFYGSGKR